MSSVARAHVASAPVYQRLRQLDRRGRKLARPGGRRLDPRLLGHGERVGIVALGRRKVWAGAQAQTLEQARGAAAAAWTASGARCAACSTGDPIGAVIDATPPRACA